MSDPNPQAAQPAPTVDVGPQDKADLEQHQPGPRPATRKRRHGKGGGAPHAKKRANLSETLPADEKPPAFRFTLVLDQLRRSKGLELSGLPALSQLDREGYLEVGYTWARGKPPVGRLFAFGPSGQHCSGLARRFGQGAFYHDVDQVNSSPTILAELCRMSNIACPRLQAASHATKPSLPFRC